MAREIKIELKTTNEIGKCISVNVEGTPQELASLLISVALGEPAFKAAIMTAAEIIPDIEEGIGVVEVVKEFVGKLKEEHFIRKNTRGQKADKN